MLALSGMGYRAWQETTGIRIFPTVLERKIMIKLKLWETLSRWSCKFFDYWECCLGLIAAVMAVAAIFAMIETPVTRAIADFLAYTDIWALFLFLLFPIAAALVLPIVSSFGIDPDGYADSNEVRTYCHAKQKLAKFAPLYAYQEISKVLEVARQTERIAQDNKLELKLSSKILKNTTYLKKLMQQNVFDDARWLHNYEMSKQVEITCTVLFTEWLALKKQATDKNQKLKELADKKAKLKSEQRFAKLVKLGKQIH